MLLVKSYPALRYEYANSKLSQWRGSPQKRVANLWTEFAAARILAEREWEGPQNPNQLVVAATSEKART